MTSTTPQTVRSLLQTIPRRFTQTCGTGCSGASPTFSTQCQSRRLSTQRSIDGWIHLRSPLARNEQWTRQWSCSTMRGLPANNDRPRNFFEMPPPSSHAEEKVSESTATPTHPQRQPEETSDSVAMPPPSESTEKPSDQIPDIPPTRPSPIEAEEHFAASDPIHTPAPRSKAASSASSPSMSSSSSSLPSVTAAQRWHLSEKTQKHMDDFLAKAAIFSQRVNNYTGTDYSGIEALRREIVEQERDVKTRHAAIAVSKEAYQQAYAAQAASQKEVVGLLERKHSWSAGDLERYMSLIRSEHLNEQAVQKAKEELASAERSLEDARGTLERKERKQYHEEQVWSDTIRRNSTWVTFGLMGLNILLLLANLAVIEPWRRRRLVREVRSALEENALQTNAKITAVTEASAAAGSTATAEKSVVEDVVVDQVADAVGPTVHEVEEATAGAVTEPEKVADDSEAAADTALVVGEALPEEAADQTIPDVSLEEVAETISAAAPEVVEKLEPRTWQELLEEQWAHYRKVFQDLFSDRQMTVKRVDMTAVALESAAAGVALMGLLVVLLNPR